jgi:hypothetical protein
MKHLHHRLNPLLAQSIKFPQTNPLAPGAWGHCLRDERGASIVVVTLALATVTKMIALDMGGLLTVRDRLVGSQPIALDTPATRTSVTSCDTVRHFTTRPLPANSTGMLKEHGKVDRSGTKSSIVRRNK